MVIEYNRAVVDLAMEAAEATPGVGRSQTAHPRIGVSR